MFKETIQKILIQGLMIGNTRAYKTDDVRMTNIILPSLKKISFHIIFHEGCFSERESSTRECRVYTMDI